MKKLNEKEMNLVNGGIVIGPAPMTEEEVIQEKTKKWLAKEKRKMEGIADIRMRASEDALKAAMRLNKQEADIKEAMKAQREALGLD